jgi:hydrogenase maturation factor HypF (carbamoyltransferase family)
MTDYRFARFGSPAPPLEGASAIKAAVEGLNEGRIIAIQHPSGFQLLADAAHPKAIQRLRQRKGTLLPLPLLYHELFILAEDLEVDAADMLALQSPENPIVLLTRNADPLSPLAFDALAPGLSRIGAALPGTPLLMHLMAHWQKPAVMSSANRHGAPPATHPQRDRTQLAALADAILFQLPPYEAPVPQPPILLHSPMNRTEIRFRTGTESQAPLDELMVIRQRTKLETVNSLGLFWDERGYLQYRITGRHSTPLLIEGDWGGLFKNAAAILLGMSEVHYPYEAVMRLESAAHAYFRHNFPKLTLSFLQDWDGRTAIPDYLLKAVAEAHSQGHEAALIAARLHLSLADYAGRQAEAQQADSILLSGRYFKNAWLLDLICRFWGSAYAIAC